MSHAFISTVDITMSSLYRGEIHGENLGLFGENKHINGLEINLECVIITFKHGSSVFNVCPGPLAISMPFASRRALISTSGKRLTFQIRD